MKIFKLLAVLLLLPGLAHAEFQGTLGSNNSVYKGTYGQTEISATGDTVALYTANTGNGNFYNFLQQDGKQIAYQVPSGKKLVLSHCNALSDQATSANIRLVYGDNAVGQNSGTTPTNCVQAQDGATCGSGNSLITVTLGAVGTYLEIDCSGITFPGGKYPHLYMTSANSNQIRYHGKLVDDD